MRYYQSFPTAIPLYGAGYPRVTHPSATQSSLGFDRNLCLGVFVRLACVRHAASVHPEPGSNSQIISFKRLYAFFVLVRLQNEAALHFYPLYFASLFFRIALGLSLNCSLGLTSRLPLRNFQGCIAVCLSWFFRLAFCECVVYIIIAFRHCQ